MSDGTIVVCDALCAVADALAAYLREDGLDVVATACGAEELLTAVAEYRPAVVLVDVAVCRSHPGRLVKALSCAGDAGDAGDAANAVGGVKVVILGPITAVDEAVEALQDGVQGWVSTSASGREMTKTVDAVLRGEFWMPMEMMAGILRSYTPAEIFGARQGSTDSELRVAALGTRERLVLECLVEGLDRRRIAKRLFISEHTVRTHVRRILAKLDAHSMLEAAAIGRQAGLGGS